MESPILVVMAAGMGSRYGGLKQMDKLGKNGEVLLDYSVFDAIRSGFKKVIFVIRYDLKKDFEDTVLSRLGSSVKWELAYQNPDSLIPENIYAESKRLGRTKPWGTAHALLCAADKIDGPFAVINADDFYGKEAFSVIGSHLCSPSANEPVIVPYRLENTLSLQGKVARGVCEICPGLEGNDCYLLSVEELTAIEKKDGAIICVNCDGSVRSLSAETLVSMNFWGFPQTVLGEFKKYFDEFLSLYAANIPGKLNDECFLPIAVDKFIKNNIISVKVLTANSQWFGITYKEDREAAVKELMRLTSTGVYPESLWQE